MQQIAILFIAGARYRYLDALCRQSDEDELKAELWRLLRRGKNGMKHEWLHDDDDLDSWQEQTMLSRVEEVRNIFTVSWLKRKFSKK